MAVVESAIPFSVCAEHWTIELALRWQNIQLFEIDDPTAEFPFSNVLGSEMNWDSEFTALAIQEYRKFMFLCSLFPGQMTPSVNVDTVWHLHLLYTRSYFKFCEQALERSYMHHEPAKGGSDEDAVFTACFENTLCRYQQYFGAPPESIWASISP